MKLKIAVVQFKIETYKPESNIKRAEEFIKKASKKADIIVFPEDFITGPIKLKLEEFVDKNQRYVQIFQNFAKKYKIDIIPGTIIEKDKKGYHNVSYYIGYKGNIKSRYCKINLWHPEKTYLNPGNKISVFNTRFGKIGLTICWDIFFPELFRKMTQQGVKIVFCPSYWTLTDGGMIGHNHDPNCEINLTNSLATARAFENGIIFIYCNGSGKLILPSFKAKLMGNSQITVPFKGQIKRLNHANEEMFIQEVDTSILDDSEKAYKIRKDIKKGILV